MEIVKKRSYNSSTHKLFLYKNNILSGLLVFDDKKILVNHFLEDRDFIEIDFEKIKGYYDC